jgi:hypothetical protein
MNNFGDLWLHTNLTKNFVIFKANLDSYNDHINFKEHTQNVRKHFGASYNNR